MILFSKSTIYKSCRIARAYFPSTFIIDIFKDITGAQDLSNFPDIKLFEAKILNTKKAGMRMPLKALDAISVHFYQEPENFLNFLKSLTPQRIQQQMISKVDLDDFISKINILLSADSNLRIEGAETIQKWVPNTANKEIYLNIDVPSYIEDYFTEALDCFAYSLFRSSILFCTFALEASLRYKYAELRSRTKAYSIKFSNLIDWGIENNFIEQNEFNRVNIEFIRRYRNDLTHCNMSKPDAEFKISRGYAQKMVSIVVYLVEFLINNIFHR